MIKIETVTKANGIQADFVLDAITGLDKIRNAEVNSIRQFVKAKAHLLTGHVLDFGAGKPGTCREPQPYRALLPCDMYTPFDLGDDLPAVDGMFDNILCTQVLNYVGPIWAVENFRRWLKPGGRLVCTYPTCWDEVEDGDFWRFTRSGAEKILKAHGFRVLEHERRAEVIVDGYFRFPLGYGVVAVAE